MHPIPVLTTKLLGDAGEHYALSKLTFAGHAAAKMPEGWREYDLAVHTVERLLKVSVKTRSETDRWKTGNWFTFDERSHCDWLVFIFKQQNEDLRSWIIPFEVARSYGNVPSERRKDPHMRDLSWSKLNKLPLSRYENNWKLLPDGAVAGDA